MILKDFKGFLQQNNIIDFAAAVVMGSAFTQIVSSFVSDLLNPFLTLVSKDTDLKGFVFTIGKATFNIGSFVQASINFFTIAFFLFIFVRFAKKIARKVEHTVVDPVDERILDPLEKKLFTKKFRTSSKVAVNKDAIISQVQQDLKKKMKNMQP